MGIAAVGVQERALRPSARVCICAWKEHTLKQPNLTKPGKSPETRSQSIREYWTASTAFLAYLQVDRFVARVHSLEYNLCRRTTLCGKWQQVHSKSMLDSCVQIRSRSFALEKVESRRMRKGKCAHHSSTVVTRRSNCCSCRQQHGQTRQAETWRCTHARVRTICGRATAFSAAADTGVTPCWKLCCGPQKLFRRK